MQTLLDEYGGVIVRLSLIMAGITALFVLYDAILKLGI